MLKRTVNGVICPLHMSVQDIKENHYKVSPGFIHEDGVLPLSELLGRTITITPTGKVHCNTCLDEYVGCAGEVCDVCCNPLLDSGNVPHVVYLSLAQSAVIGSVPVLDARERWAALGASQVLPIARTSNATISSEIIAKSGLRDIKGVSAAELLSGCSEGVSLLDFENDVRNAIDGHYDAHSCAPMYASPIHYDFLKPTEVNDSEQSLDNEVTGIFIGAIGNLLLLDCGYVDLIQLSGLEVALSLE